MMDVVGFEWTMTYVAFTCAVMVCFKLPASVLLLFQKDSLIYTGQDLLFLDNFTNNAKKSLQSIFLAFLQAFLLLGLWLWEKKFGPTPMWGAQPGDSSCQEFVSEVVVEDEAADSERTPLLPKAHASASEERLGSPVDVQPNC